MYYHVVRFSPTSWHMDGSGVVERDCGHKHRSRRTAEQCLSRLLAYDHRTQTWSAAWHGAVVQPVIDAK